MKKRFKVLMVLGIMTIAMVTTGVPLGKHYMATESPCYSELEVEFLMKANHCQRDQAIELLELSCEYAITPK